MKITLFGFALPKTAALYGLPPRSPFFAAAGRFFHIQALFAAVLLMAACENGLNGNEYSLRAPELPAAWSVVLGEPSWAVEWVDGGGVVREAVCENIGRLKITPFTGEYTPVSARPFWPDKGIRAGIFYGAGAIFPLDFDGSEIKLSWQGGIDANFYKLLAVEGNTKRLPKNFDWKRFRELFTSGKIEKEALQNPWLADWPDAAKKTAESSFSASRIKARKRHYLTVSIPAGGPWIGASPFTQPFDWTAGEAAPIALIDDVEFFFSPHGTLRCGRLVNTFRPFTTFDGEAAPDAEPAAADSATAESAAEPAAGAG